MQCHRILLFILTGLICACGDAPSTNVSEAMPAAGAPYPANPERHPVAARTTHPNMTAGQPGEGGMTPQPMLTAGSLWAQSPWPVRGTHD